jgi:curved DNA-binding protein
MASDHDDFIDYYEILQVSPNCDSKILESAYRYLAKQYHPDHPDTADGARFYEIIEAHSALKNPEQRAAYDLIYASRNIDKLYNKEHHQEDRKDKLSNDTSAASDANVQKNMLFSLYKRRRENASDPGIVGFYLQEAFNCSDEHFEFHIWYLKSKGFISITEQGLLAITIEGVDHVISMHQYKAKEKLFITQSDGLDD